MLDPISALVGTKVATDQTPDPEQVELGLEEYHPGVLCHGIEGSKTHEITFGSDELSRLALEGVNIAEGTGNNFFNLDRGNVVFAPDKDIVVGTHEANIYIAGGSAVFVMETGHDVAVYSLHQGSKGSVKIVSDKTLIPMDPGRFIVLTTQKRPGWRMLRDTAGAYHTEIQLLK